MNTNQETIDGLKAMIAWLEEHPDMPEMRPSIIQSISTKQKLLEIVPHFGTFKKTWNDYSLYIDKKFGVLDLTLSIPRDRVCTKRVIWDCPDEGLLQMAQEMTESEAR